MQRCTACSSCCLVWFERHSLEGCADASNQRSTSLPSPAVSLLHHGEGRIPTRLPLYTCHGCKYFTETQQLCDLNARHASVTWTRPRQSRYAMPSKSRPEAIKRRSSPVAYPAQCNGINIIVSGEVESLRGRKSQLTDLLQLSALAALTWQAAEFNPAVFVHRAIRHGRFRGST
jgi:hypothetical protein